MKNQEINVVQVTNVGNQQRFSWLGLLLILGLIGWLWKWLVAAAVIALVVWLLMVLCRKYEASQAREADRQQKLRQRADQQHQWRLAGDPRGVYGPNWRNDEVSNP